MQLLIPDKYERRYTNVNKTAVGRVEACSGSQDVQLRVTTAPQTYFTIEALNLVFQNGVVSSSFIRQVK